MPYIWPKKIETRWLRVSNKDLFPVYQPIVTGALEIVGYESFLRGNWSSTILEMFAASDPERMNTIVKWDNVSKRLALRHYQSKLPLFLNSHPFSVDPLANIKVPRSISVVIELTEHAMYDMDLHLLKMFDGYRQQGIEFAIDDFGLGYFNMPLIMKIRPAYIKICKEITAMITQDVDYYHAFAAISKTFKALGVKIIAEGIEDEETLLLARPLVDYMQGFHLGMPAPAIHPGKHFKVVGDLKG